MDPRGQSSWYGPGTQYQSSGQLPHHRDRDDPYRLQYPAQGHYPLPDPRERERDGQGYSADPRYRQYLTSPPPRPEFSPAYSSIPQSIQGYGPSHARPHSRQAYDYPPQSHWDYRDDYAYYDQGYYRGHYGYTDASGWPVQDGWRSELYQGRRLEQEWTGAAYSNQQGYEPRRDSAQYDGGVSGRDRRESWENGNRAGEMCEPGVLASSKTSGLSSSSYELSQYMNGAEQTDAAPAPHSEPEAETKAVAPLKFCVPHVAVSFGPAGQLVRVSPALPSHGEPAQVELHSLEVILSDTREQHDMRDFPGPLMREDLHKVDVISFALQMADTCLKDKSLSDASSAALLWQLLVLLCRQNGRIVGSDIAELLVRGSRSIGQCEGDSERSDIGSLIDLSEMPETDSLNTADLLTGDPFTAEHSSEQSLQNYTKLLLAGRKKEALESAMRSNLWGHALFLASKMDSRAYTTVLSRFTGSLALSDPLQTLFQLLSGRIPAVATCYSREKWRNWRPHLAVMLSNETADSVTHCRSISTLGDTLVSRGLLHAAHICYLTAHSPFSCYTNKTQRLVLLGSSHSVSFAEFSHNSSIRCTEVFEYCQRLGDPAFIIPSFQVYKLVYACRLLDCGLTSQAFHYCETVAKALLTIQEPQTVLLGELIKLVDRLKHSEAQLSETGSDLDWLDLLRQRLQDIQMGSCSGPDPSAGVEGARSPEESREYGGSNVHNLSTSGEMVQPSPPESRHNNTVEEHYEHYQPASQQSHSFYHSEEPSYHLIAAQPHVSEEQFPQVCAPVPLYSLQNSLAAPPSQPLAVPGLPQLPTDQNGFNHDDPSYHHLAASVGLRSRSNTGVEFPTDTNVMNSSENGSAPGADDMDMSTQPEPDTQETDQKSEKGSKSGWFSGWFRSKPKENPQDQTTEAKSPEPKPIPTLPPLFTPPGPMASPTMLTSQPQAADINPFSRRAGQKFGAVAGHNFGSMSQSP